MKLEKAFRLSLYLSLALACASLGLAEDWLLPGVVWFLVPVGLVLILAYLVEGRWALSAAGSNCLAILLVGIGGFWAFSQLTSPSNVLVETVPWTVAMLPYAGPLLMLLLLSKLFRPKATGDYWQLYGVGVIEASLACVLGNSAWVGSLLFLYLVCLVWSLMLFYLERERAKTAAHVPEAKAGADDRPTPVLWGTERSTAGTGPVRVGVPWQAWGLGQAFSRATLAAMLAGLLFFLPPRATTAQWNLLTMGQGITLESGFSRMIDLNRTGHVQTSNEVAFTVFAQDARDNPKPDLDAGQRWRGVTLDLYDLGRWQGRHLILRSPGFEKRNLLSLNDPARLPRLGPGSYALTFQMEYNRSKGVFLADPVGFPNDEDLPPVVWQAEEVRPVPAFNKRDGTLMAPRGMRGATLKYRQVLPTRPDQAITPATSLDRPYIQNLSQNTLPQVREWTLALMRRLAGQKVIADADLQLVPDRAKGWEVYVKPENRARVAQALSNYLSSSGEFSYTLDTRRHDLTLDPAEDFLFNAREGYCEHFASGLTLMLRSVGIPARMVVGFRGFERPEADTDPGIYYVTQSNAHAWVEVLLERPTAKGETEYFWLTLDPTPAADFHLANEFFLLTWWKNFREFWGDWWRGLIDFNGDRQRDLVDSLGDRLMPEGGVARKVSSLGVNRPGAVWLGPGVLLAAVVLGWIIWKRLRPRPHRGAAPPMVFAEAAAAVGLYARFVAVAEHRFRLRPALAHTPREFGREVEAVVRQRGWADHLADVPRFVVGLIYAVRFGGRALAPADLGEAERRLTELDSAGQNQAGS